MCSEPSCSLESQIEYKSIKEKASPSPASISLYFLTMDTVWPDISCSLFSLPWYTIFPQAMSQNRLFFLMMIFVRYFVIAMRKVRQYPSKLSGLGMLLSGKYLSYMLQVLNSIPELVKQTKNQLTTSLCLLWDGSQNKEFTYIKNVDNEIVSLICVCV